MKSIKKLAFVLAVAALFACKKENTALTETTFGVRGNCGMCKKTIEKSALTVDGVEEAEWDKSNKTITVKFEKAKTRAEAIQKAIANAGYDTEQKEGITSAYTNLPRCCQYDRNMEMNRSN